MQLGTCRAEEKVKLMAEVLVQAQEKNYDTATMVKKQSTFLSQLAAKTIPKGLHCFSMSLTVEYHMLPLNQRDFPHQERLEDPSLYHYALFSDNILATGVVVNSAISNAKVCSHGTSLSP
jgi:alpha-1,4-galacturonosyltransferase